MSDVLGFALAPCNITVMSVRMIAACLFHINVAYSLATLDVQNSMFFTGHSEYSM